MKQIALFVAIVAAVIALSFAQAPIPQRYPGMHLREVNVFSSRLFCMKYFL